MEDNSNDTADDEDTLDSKKKPTRPVVLTQSNSFITRIKSTFSKNKSQEVLPLNEQQEENILSAADIAAKEELLVPAIDNDSSVSSVDDEDDSSADDALEQRLVRQVTEMFSRSMFMYSNTGGK